MIFEEIVVHRILQSNYYKEMCFGLNAATIVDRAVKLQYVGGTFGGNQKASEFICLLYRLSIIKPSKEIVLAYINNSSFKYLSALGLLYFRMTMDASSIYQTLEPFFSKYQKLRYRTTSEFQIIHMDEFIDKLLNEERVCSIILPRIMKRAVLEDIYGLPLYVSPISKLLNDEDSVEENETQAVPDINVKNKASAKHGYSKNKASKLFKKKTKIPEKIDFSLPTLTLEEINIKRISDGLEPITELKN
eukprot:NODE_6_length_70510_cov_1.054395.p36 type:complete len:247 gc:universal NODE_6_length_70510_cov_1.054395:57573-56833(-)